MPVYKRTKMCSECPFRKKAPAGWLGPWTITEVEQMVQFDQSLICHLDVKAKDHLTLPEIEETGQHCVGFLRYMNDHLKCSRDPVKAMAQAKLKKVKDQEIIPARKFREHHERSPADSLEDE